MLCAALMAMRSEAGLAAERYGLPDRVRTLDRITAGIALGAQAFPGFRLGEGGVSVPFYRYAWTHEQDGAKGELLIAVCGDRETAEYIWRLHLSGFSKLKPSAIVSGGGARHGDIELDNGAAIHFLRNNVFCSVDAHKGVSSNSLRVAAQLLASKLSQKLAEVEQPVAEPRRTPNIAKFAAIPPIARKGEEVVLEFELEAPTKEDTRQQVEVRYLCTGGRVSKTKAGQLAFVAREAGQYEVRALAFCALNVVLSRTAGITVRE